MNTSSWKQLFSTFEKKTSSLNRFQPQPEDVAFAKQVGFGKVPLKTWLDAVVFYPGFRVDYAVEQDQEIRARALINFYFASGRDIVLMDGHGRMVRRLLMGGVSASSIHVVELNETVHEFHTWFFPRGVKCYLGNIFTTQLRDATYPFYYYNFCGIRESVQDIHAIQDEHMISFSVARTNFLYGAKLVANRRRIPKVKKFKNSVTKEVDKYLQARGGRIVAYRPDFITIWVKPIRAKNNMIN